ncbi:polyprenyl synthetase family protein [Paenibacillus sp. GSMTC-2017]|uniref:polyprenyl synthetase family protein n=1 Tax=Paenibacillus sp. GSMTC-2017 TaxID=2794350 RepID=UPI0018D7E00E|nr:polyprenyl synthetase family protein [Paenibacillus sp. GSMTC-2017]MBH5320028.1 polyprenyl synthetase family protein [Paenibacillus sp. GSMTC-2017]
MEDLNERLGHRMQEIVQRWFITSHLSEYALTFIEDRLQESLLFGQLTIAHYRMFEGKEADIEQAAAAVELFKLAADILDDLQDGDAPSKPWMNTPQPLVLHVATSFIILSQQALLESVNSAQLRGELALMMNKQLLQSANGQMIDLMNDITDEQDYLDMVKQKTGALMVFTCMAGVILAGRPWDDTVEQYALNLGISAQIRNDVRDLLSWDEKSDFLTRKKTLLTLYLLDTLSENTMWLKEYYDGDLEYNEISNRETEFQQFCDRSGATLYGSVIGRMHYNLFENMLGNLPVETCWKDDILQILSENRERN